MDPTSAVRTDTLPAIATVVAPGALASAPYAWVGLSANPNLRAFLNEHEGIALASAILLWIVVGFAVESTGSYVEVYLIDRRRADRKEMLDVWWRYLQLAWEHEPIGARYLRRLLVSFKFELNMFVATLASMPGVLALGCTGRLSRSTTLAMILLQGIAAWLAFRAAVGSAEVLAEVRARLVGASGYSPSSEGSLDTPRSGPQ